MLQLNSIFSSLTVTSKERVNLTYASLAGNDQSDLARAIKLPLCSVCEVLVMVDFLAITAFLL